MMDNKRIEYIDVMRGIGIVLMCLGHSIALLSEPVNTFISIFHMPLFFFVSGMLFYKKELGNFWGFLKKKCLSILVPQLLLAAVIFIEQLLICIVKKDVSVILEIDISSLLLGWFLIVLFVAEIIIYWILKFIKKRLYIALVTVVFFVGFLLCNIDIMYLQQILCATFFALLGFLFRPIIEHYHKKNNSGYLLPLLFLVAVLSHINTSPVGMYMNQYGNKFIFIIGAFLGIVAVADLSFLFNDFKPLQFFGKNSIIIYVTHRLLLTIISSLFNKMLVFFIGTAGLNRLYPWYFLPWLIVLLLEVPLILFCNRFTPWLFGKK